MIRRIAASDAFQTAQQMLFGPASGEDRNVRLVFWDGVWVAIMAAGAGTFLSVFMARLGASNLQLSLLMSIPAAVSMLTTLPASAYVERQQDQVRTVTVYRALYRSVYVILALAPFFLDRGLILVISILSGIQQALKEVQGLAFFSVVTAVVPIRRRPSVNGLRWAVTSIVSAIAVALFGRFLQVRSLFFPLNYQLLFGLTAVVGFAGLVSFSRIREPSDERSAPRYVSWARHLRSISAPVAHDRDFVRYLASTALLRLGMALPAGLLSVFWVDQLQAQDSVIGLQATVAQMALVIGYLVFGRMAIRRGHRAVLLLSATGLGLYPVATALCPNQYWLLPVAVLSGFFNGGLAISFFEAVAIAAPPGMRPSYNAFNNLTAGVAAFAGPLFGAGIANRLGITTAFFFAGALHVAGALLCWRLGVGRPLAS